MGLKLQALEVKLTGTHLVECGYGTPDERSADIADIVLAEIGGVACDRAVVGVVVEDGKAVMSRRGGAEQHVSGRDELTKRKLEPEELRRLVADERREILAELTRLASDDESARAKEAKRQARSKREAGRLLLRGKGLLSVVEMAGALGWTRQIAHRAIREAEGRGGDTTDS